MSKSNQAWVGLSTSLKLLGFHLIEGLLLRGRLISIELAQERRRLFVLMAWTMATAFFGMMTMIVATLFVIALLWEWNPLLALGGVTAVYAFLALIGFVRLAKVLNNLPGILSETMAVIRKDFECWSDKENAT